MLSCTTAQIDYVTSLPLYTTSTLQICRSKCTNICFTTLVVRYIISLTKVHGLPQSFNAPDGCCCSFAKYGTGSILCDAWNSKACGRTTCTSYSTAPSFSHGRSLFQDGPNCHPSDPIHDTLQRWWRVQWGKRNQRVLPIVLFCMICDTRCHSPCCSYLFKNGRSRWGICWMQGNVATLPLKTKILRQQSIVIVRWEMCLLFMKALISVLRYIFLETVSWYINPM